MGIQQKGTGSGFGALGSSMGAGALDTVRAFISAINRHDVAALSKLMSAHHAFVDPAGTLLSGPESMAAGWTEYFRMFPDYQIQAERLMADGACVAVFGSASGTYNGKRGLVAENRIAMPAAWKAVVENGEVVLWQVYADWTEGLKTMARDNEAR